MMLRRIDNDVPNGTDIVILEPGGNDRRFFVSKEQRTANIAEMERRLQARSISVIVYDEEMPLRYRAFDLMHFTHQGQRCNCSEISTCGATAEVFARTRP
jgi:acyl-CoA thioesterase-1